MREGEKEQLSLMGCDTSTEEAEAADAAQIKQSGINSKFWDNLSYRTEKNKQKRLSQ